MAAFHNGLSDRRYLVPIVSLKGMFVQRGKNTVKVKKLGECGS